MMSALGHRILTCDLDPQANLSAAFLDEDRLDTLWNGKSTPAGSTIFRCVEPLLGVQDLASPALQEIRPSLRLIPGDLALSSFEDSLSSEWTNANGSINLYRPFRMLTAFWTVMQAGAKLMDASIILADVGPNLGAINRSALIATDHVVTPLGADLFSLQGLRNLGPTLGSWRTEWKRRRDNWSPQAFPLPEGRMGPLGYVAQQHSVRLSRPVKAYDRWLNRMPEEYARSILTDLSGPYPASPSEDKYCLATLNHYRSLVPMAREVRKPIFELTSADGAIGSHAGAVNRAREDFENLANLILDRSGVASFVSEDVYAG